VRRLVALVMALIRTHNRRSCEDFLIRTHVRANVLRRVGVASGMIMIGAPREAHSHFGPAAAQGPSHRIWHKAVAFLTRSVKP
jgi:hypothetical protein